jgi:hypothetical protein
VDRVYEGTKCFGMRELNKNFGWWMDCSHPK